MSSESRFTVLFMPLDPDVEWWCQAPRHAEKFEPRARWCQLIWLKEERSPEGGLIAHQAQYCCDECKNIMEGDL